MRTGKEMDAVLNEEPEQILVLQAGGIGDAVMATPALTAIRGRFPDAHIAVVVAPRAAAVVRSLDMGFELKTLELGDTFAQFTDAARLIRDTQETRPDLLIDLTSIESSAAARKRRWLAQFIRPKLALGRNTDGRGAFFDAAPDESLFDHQHEIDRKLRVLAPLGIQVEDPQPLLHVPDAAQKAASLALAEAGISDSDVLFGINPGALLPTRRWPIENFERLASVLTEEADRALLVTGGEEERGLVERVAGAARGKVASAVAKPLMEVAALIGRCRIFITNDTGVMHIAAAQNVPVVALFGRTNSHRYRPRMPADRCVVLQRPTSVCVEFKPGTKPTECRRESCPTVACMTTMSFDWVFHAVEHLLESH